MTAVIVLWNTVYLDRAIQAIRFTASPLKDYLMKICCNTCPRSAGNTST